LNPLNANGTMIVLGAPPAPAQIPAFSVVMKSRSIIGSLIGGIKETQEMPDYCARYCFVIDIASLK
jgi:uncharacterized zinc-type alcohol dehydrogenase-like protein